MVEFDHKGNVKDVGSISVILRPHKEEDNFDYEKLKGVSNTILDSLRSQLVPVETFRVMTQEETAKILGGDSRFVDKAIMFNLRQEKMGKLSVIPRSDIDKIRKAILRRVGKVSDEWFMVCK